MILDEIVANKKKEILKLKEIASLNTIVKKIEQTNFLNKSYVEHIKTSNGLGIIAEIKKKSPSKGEINSNIVVSEVARAYQDAGASAISVLTDYKYFAGCADDFMEARSAVHIPVLRKDFTVDEYCIYEAKLLGADIILLIARILTPKEVNQFAKLAKDLNLEVLLEVHSAAELKSHINEYIDIIGVNNRDLDTLQIDLNLSRQIIEAIPSSVLKISESGISDPQVVKELKSIGYDGFLIGENFMKTSDPGRSLKDFINSILDENKNLRFK